MPTIIKLYPSVDDQISLQRYLKTNKILNPQDTFSSTVWYSLGPLFKRLEIEGIISSTLPLTIRPPYRIDLFENSLVLRYDSNEINTLKGVFFSEKRRQTLEDFPSNMSKEELGIIQKILLAIPQNIPEENNFYGGIHVGSEQRTKMWFNSRPHITLATGADHSLLDKIGNYTLPITFEGIVWELDY